MSEKLKNSKPVDNSGDSDRVSEDPENLESLSAEELKVLITSKTQELQTLKEKTTSAYQSLEDAKIDDALRRLLVAAGATKPGLLLKALKGQDDGSEFRLNDKGGLLKNGSPVDAELAIGELRRELPELFVKPKASKDDTKNRYDRMREDISLIR